MTHRNTWKSLERRVAATLSTERTPLSGSNSKITSSDTLSDTYYVECKLKARLPLHSLFLKTQMQARKEGKKPILVLHKKFSMQNLVVLNLEDFIEIEKQEGNL